MYAAAIQSGGNLSAASTSSELNSTLNSLENVLSDMTNALESLGQRLIPITSQYVAGDKKAQQVDAPRPAPSCEIVGRIGNVVERLQNMRSAIAQQTDALVV